MCTTAWTTFLRNTPTPTCGWLPPKPPRTTPAPTKAPQDYTSAHFQDGCWLFFGKETAGLPQWFREAHPDRCIRIPMREDARSLNLSNSVAILTYEALRQQGFPGLTGTGEMAQAGQ